MALNIARIALETSPTPGLAQIHHAVEQAAQVIRTLHNAEIDPIKAVDELETMFRVLSGPGFILDSSEGHEPWLEQRRSELPWLLWKRYKQYLAEKKSYPPAVLTSLDDQTNEILGRLENPERGGEWDRRGMVVGHVQSGKTGNYIGLINKAIDSGYQLVIVLAGRHNSLRSQTQQRIDEGVLGYDTQTHRPGEVGMQAFGVGTLPLPGPGIITLTSSHDTGDFVRAVASRTVARLGANTIVLVVKKTKSILESVHRWCRNQGETRAGMGTVCNVPVLIIDDEADDASINTRAVPRGQDGNPEAEHSVTAINGSIRKLLKLFPRSAYVAYTATPYANIYIHTKGQTETLGEDLFPRSFIQSLPAPGNYIGPGTVFGTDAVPDDPAQVIQGLDIVRSVQDWDSWIPEGHDRFHRPPPLPQSLREAIRVFVLVCAARRSRGQLTAHNSMLVHVTRFTAVQKLVANEIKAELKYISQQLEYESNATDSIYSELEIIWQREFEPRLEEPTPWVAVRKQLLAAVMAIRVLELNGSAKDTLEYYSMRNVGLSAIAVGGDKLSRGLTLEGLSVSYYLRASRMYDTLMQMGRWFGYRPGYRDLCRLYTTPELIDWYAHITRADAELRGELEEMALRGLTPELFGLRVKSHPALSVTASNKMRNGSRIELSYAGDISETVAFHRDPVNITANRVLIEKSLAELETPAHRLENRLVWSDVEPEIILNLLENYRVHEDSRRMQPKLLAQYIRNRIGAGRLTRWTVALIFRNRGEHRTVMAGHDVGMIERTIMPGDTPGRVSIRRLLNPVDEQVDLGSVALERALAATRKLRGESLGRPGGPQVRAQRHPESGLLLIYPLWLSRDADQGRGMQEIALETIGLAVSFPPDPDAQKMEYVVNSVYWDEEFSEE